MRVNLTQTEMGAGGLGASQHAVGKSIRTLSPAAVVMVGIAFGMNVETQNVGDILVSKQLRNYDDQRVGTHNGGDPAIILRSEKPHASIWLLSLLRSAEHSFQGAKLCFGTILTGAKLVDHFGLREQLRALEPEAIGGEMEGAGLYVACHDEKVDWIIVKAICDFADGKKATEKAKHQGIAAKNAAAFVYHALRYVRVDWQQHHRATRGSRAQIKIVAGEPVRESEVHLATYQYDNKGYSLVATCRDVATCNDVAAMYKAIVRSSNPIVFCGKSSHLSATPVGAFAWSTDPHQNLPAPNDTFALCARVNACMIATDRDVPGDPYLECQKEPRRFKISCGGFDDCNDVLDCATSIDAKLRYWWFGR